MTLDELRDLKALEYLRAVHEKALSSAGGFHIEAAFSAGWAARGEVEADRVREYGCAASQALLTYRAKEGTQD